MDQNTKEYRLKQLDKIDLKGQYPLSLQIVDGEGNKTNYMNISFLEYKKIFDALTK